MNKQDVINNIKLADKANMTDELFEKRRNNWADSLIESFGFEHLAKTSVMRSANEPFLIYFDGE